MSPGTGQLHPIEKEVSRPLVNLLRFPEFLFNLSYPLESFKIIRALKPDQRSFCRNCSLFLNKRIQQDDAELKSHLGSQNHEIIKEVTDEMLNEPVKHLLKPVELNAFNAVIVACFVNKTRHIQLVNKLFEFP